MLLPVLLRHRWTRSRLHRRRCRHRWTFLRRLRRLRAPVLVASFVARIVLSREDEDEVMKMSEAVLQ